jgi:hypothetical protein
MSIVTAFMDDSGGTDPNSGNVLALGLIVIDSQDLRQCSEAWSDTVARHLTAPKRHLSLSGLEAKSSDLYAMLTRLQMGKPLSATQNLLFQNGLNTSERVEDLINDLWRLLANHPARMRYLGSVTFKHSVWQKYRKSEYADWKAAPDKVSKGTKKALSQFVGEKTFEYLLQRLQYLGDDREFPFTDAVLVGDQSAIDKLMYTSQAEAQAGLGHFTMLPKLLNNVWFGSSLHNPSLQMADWVAFACRLWAERKTPRGVSPLGYIVHRFRGYPNRVKGVGIAVNPAKANVPAMPQRVRI